MAFSGWESWASFAFGSQKVESLIKANGFRQTFSVFWFSVFRRENFSRNFPGKTVSGKKC